MSLHAPTLRKALADIERVAWSSHHPHIPFDITVEEASRGSVGPDGRFRLHPADVAARALVERVAA